MKTTYGLPLRLSKKRTDLKFINTSDIPPVVDDRKKGEIDTEVFIPKTEINHEKKPKQKIKRSNDPRSKFYEYCDNFFVDSFQIPRPLKSPSYGANDITDSHCALYALTLLSVPHIDLDVALEPIGWLDGPHLLVEWLGKDWSLAFDGERLKYHLKTNPWLVVTDSAVQLAIRILRVKCDQGTPRESKLAKHILEDIGLDLMIPKQATERRSEDITLRHYSNHPDILIASVRLYEFVIQKYRKAPYKRSESQKKKEHCAEAFRLIFRKAMPPKLIEGEKNSSPANVALAFIGYETNTKYTSLHKIFYPNSKVISDNNVYSKLDQITDNKGDKLTYIAELKKKYTGN